MRYFTDEDVNPAVADIARGLGLDVVSVHELRRQGLDDRVQLDFAATENRLLVTRNRDDFIKLTVSRFQAAEPHRGIIVIPYTLPNKEPARIAHALKRWDEEHDREDCSYGIFFLHA